MVHDDRPPPPRTRRSRVAGSARIHTPGGAIDGPLVDLSLGGALVRVPDWAHDEMLTEEVVRVELRLGEHVHDVNARIAVRSPDTIAIVFVDPLGGMMEEIAQLVIAGLEADRTEAERPARPTVLVVDDDDDLRDMLVGVLRAAGYGAEGAGDGRVALEMLRAEPGRYSVILLDYRMPNLDGKQFRRLQQVDPAIAGIPVILTSGASDVDEAAIDPDASLRKPVSTPALLAVVESVRLPS
jgi:CheY-like chemotaxis protein